ncbi:MAG: hypothetical protein IT450_17985 [Phycisphaerales bacterium]|nr:hypothetical protein [Phycisphaerales bacterium]
MPITSAIGPLPVFVASSTGGVSLTVDPKRPYTFHHRSKNVSDADALGRVAIFYGLDPGGDLPGSFDMAELVGKVVLNAGESCRLASIAQGGAGQSKLGGSVILMSESGAPLVQIIPGEREVL